MRHFHLHIGILVAITFGLTLPAHARPPKGFHSGPYLQVLAGATNASFDRNLVTNTATGRNQEFAVGFLFGWHTSDSLGPFMEVRYSTDKNGGNRTHMVNGNLGLTYTLVLDALTNFKSLRILPYVGGDAALHVDALPSAPGASNSIVDRYGVGPGVVAGVNFLFKRYIYIGAMFQEDIPYFFQRNEVVSGVSTPVYAGGWHAQWGTSLNAGFHF